MTRPIRRISTGITAFAFLVASLATAFIVPVQNAQALSGADFNPGRIIDDNVFYNQSAMTVDQIQSFLNSQVPECDTNGSRPASEFRRSDITRAQYAALQGWHGPPYTCLRDYRQNTPQIEAASGLCDAIPAKSNQTAAQIIYDVSQACHINPQVYMVLLQKEQSLITDTWPLAGQFTKAVGYACPDSRLGTDVDANQNGCFDWAEGFANQIYYAGRQYQAYRSNPNNYSYRAGRTQDILYNPNDSCGASGVYIENQATAALYIYTPYQPNAAALNNLYGTGDGCSAYGNRNFWRLFRDWFGTTYSSVGFVGLSDPRYMEITTSTRKIDALTMQPVDGTLAAGTVLKFTSKPPVLINGKGCLRTESDTTYNYRKCIPMAYLKEVNIAPTAITPVVMRTTRDVLKTDMRRDTSILIPVSAPLLPQSLQLTISGQYSIGGKSYYVTQSDMQYFPTQGILASDLTASTATYQPIDPVVMELAETTRKVAPTTGTQLDSELGKGGLVTFTSRANVGGNWFYRSERDTTLKVDKAIPQSKLLTLEYTALDQPRWMQIKTAGKKVSPTGTDKSTVATDTLTVGQTIKFVSKIGVNGKWYYRTASDTTHSVQKAVPAELVQEIPYSTFAQPRVMTLTTNTAKYAPAAEQATGEVFSAGLQLRFVSKIEVNGQWYYRTESDTQYNRSLGFPASVVGDYIQ